MNDSMNSNASFSNKTDINTVDFPQVVIYTVAQFLLLTTEVYILAAFSQFVKKNRTSGHHQISRSGISRKRKILIALLMLVTITGILRAWQSVAILFFPNNNLPSAIACTIFLNVYYVIYVLGLTFLYVFLWFRQHTLYVLPSMKKMIPNSVKRFSNSLLGIILITAVGSGAGFVLGNPPERITFDAETQTCVFSDFRDNKIFIINIASYVMLIFFQGSLLFCFVFVLRRHQTDMKKHQHDKLGSTSKSSSHSLQKLIKNCAKAAAICMVTDITILAISIPLPSSAQLYNLLLFDLDYVINLSCTVVCFSAWKTMIDPWNLRLKIKNIFFSSNQNRDIQSPISIQTSSENSSKFKMTQNA